MITSKKYISLTTLVKKCAFHFYEEKDAKMLLDFFSNFSKIIFNFNENFLFNVDSSIVDRMIPFVGFDKICYERIKHIFYSTKAALYYKDVSCVATFYENDVDDPSSQNLEKNHIAFHLSDFFGNKGKISTLPGSPTIFFSTSILSYICVDVDAINLLKSELMNEILSVRAWIKKNNYVVPEFKQFERDTVSIFSKSTATRTKQFIWRCIREEM